MKLAEKLAEIRDGMTNASGRLTGSIPPEKRRLVFIISSVVLVFLLVIFAVTKLSSADKSGSSVSSAGRTTVRQGFIPPEDLFLPDEPDFIPGVIPDREQRTIWTYSDAKPWWQDPLKNGEEQWRRRIELTIDAIMESVP